MPRTFVVVDDHPLFRTALVQLLATDADVHEVADVSSLISRLERDAAVDLVLLDLNLPGVSGFAALLMVRGQFPQVPILVISADTSAGAELRSLELGASGYLNKSAPPDEIRHAIETILAGGVWANDVATAPKPSRLLRLSAQQIRVLMLMSDGLMNKQIAHELSIAEATVKAHVSAILQRLDVDNRTQAVILARALNR